MEIDNNNNNYTKETEDILASYALESECLYIVHEKNYIFYRKRGYYFTIPVIILTTMTGVLSFDKSIQSTSIGSYGIGTLNILCGITSTVYKFLDYSKLENQHRILAIEYLHLFEEIKGVLQKEPLNRPDGLLFIASVEKKRQELLDNFPIINEKIRKEFKKSHKTIDLPLRLNNIPKIHIYGRKETESEYV